MWSCAAAELVHAGYEPSRCRELPSRQAWSILARGGVRRFDSERFCCHQTPDMASPQPGKKRKPLRPLPKLWPLDHSERRISPEPLPPPRDRHVFSGNPESLPTAAGGNRPVNGVGGGGFLKAAPQALLQVPPQASSQAPSQAPLGPQSPSADTLFTVETTTQVHTLCCFCVCRGVLRAPDYISTKPRAQRSRAPATVAEPHHARARARLYC